METPVAAPSLNERIDEFYTSGYDEFDRLSRDAVGRLELVRTQELLARYLPAPPARVLDVGGGPGVYAAWLAKLGYEVTLVEPVARHREQAAGLGAFTVEPGDARRLARPDGEFDVILLLGPLYHLVDPAERAQALAEAKRVVRPGGLIAGAFISRQAPLIDVAARLRVNDDSTFTKLGRLRGTGENATETGFTVAYFHKAEEMRADFAAAGLGEPELFSIEGPLFPLLASGLVEDRPEYFEAAVRAARLAEGHEEVLGAASHVLGVVRA